MAKADELGISDISYTKVKSIIGAFILRLKEEGDNEYKFGKRPVGLRKYSQAVNGEKVKDKVENVNGRVIKNIVDSRIKTKA